MKKIAFFTVILSLLLLENRIGFSSVLPDGSYNYQVSIDFKTGIGNASPQLVLNYNSRSKLDDVLGIGWSLSGIPAVTRINHGEGIKYIKSNVYDSIQVSDSTLAESKNLVANESISVNNYVIASGGELLLQAGQKVELRPGLEINSGGKLNASIGKVAIPTDDTFTGPHGRLIPDGSSTYLPEFDPFNHYTALYENSSEVNGVCSAPTGGICGWKLVDKKGNTWIFGGTEDSRVEAIGYEGAIRVWTLNRFEDPHGNSYTIEYLSYNGQQQNGDYYPHKIRFFNGANTQISQLIEFQYSDKSNIRLYPDYSQNAKVVRSKQLDSITLKVGEQGIDESSFQNAKRYSISYDQDKLISIETLSGNNTVLSNRKFEWLSDQGSMGFTIGGNSYYEDDPSRWDLLTQDYNYDYKEEICQYNDYIYSHNILCGRRINNYWSKTSGGLMKTSGNIQPGFALDLNGDLVSDRFFIETFSSSINRNWLVHLNKPGTDKGYNYTKFTGNDWVPDSNFLIGDFDGNLKQDVLALFNNGFYRYYYSNDTSSIKIDKVENTGVFPTTEDVIVIGDFIGDGIDNIFISNSNGGGHIYKATKDELILERSVSSNNLSFCTSNCQNYKIYGADHNGDGLTDLLFVGTTSHLYHATGNGYFEFVESSSEFTSASEFLFQDVNNDGKADIIKHNSSGLDVFASTGWSFEKAFSHIGTADGKVVTIDTIGDGYRDIILETKSLFNNSRGSGTPFITSHYHDGKRSHISYAHIRDIPNERNLSNTCTQALSPVDSLGKECGFYNLTPRHVVSKIRESDGREKTGWFESGLDTDLVLNYRYENGRRYPGLINERKDLGFSKVEETKAIVDQSGEQQILSIVTNSYHQNVFYEIETDLKIPSPVIGQLYSSTTIIPSLGLKNLIYHQYNQSAGYNQFGAEKGIKLIRLEKRNTVRSEYVDSLEDYRNTSVVAEQNIYDEIERPTQKKKTIYSAGSCSSNSSTCSENILIQNTEYVTWNPGDKWDAYTPTYSEKITNGQITEANRFTLQPDAPKKVISIEKLMCENSTECSESSSGEWIQTKHSMDYNSSGLLIEEQDALNRQLVNEYDEAGRKTKIEKFDNGEMIYTQSFAFNIDGQLSVVTDENDEPTQYSYDGLGGLLSSIENPKGGVTSYSYQLANPDSQVSVNNPISTTTTKLDSFESTELNPITELKGQSVTKYLDGFGRNYHTEIDNDITSSTDLISKIDLVYEYLGTLRSEKISEVYAYDESDKKWNITNFDELGRIVNAAKSDGTEVTYNYNYDYAKGLDEVTMTTSHGTSDDKSATTLINSMGWIVEKTDELNNVIKFEYDPAGRLIESIVGYNDDTVPDSQKKTTLVFDNFGRKRSMVDPVSGQKTYAYDLIGNMTSVTNSLGDVISYNYDGRNRILQKTVNKDKPGERVVATFSYDTYPLSGLSFSNNYPIGKLTEVRDETGTYIYTYDQLGHQTRKISRIEGIPEKIEQTEFSLFGKPLLYLYPDNAKQAVTYNSRGIVDGVFLKTDENSVFEQYAAYSNFDLQGRYHRKTLKNNVVSNYGYDSKGRLGFVNTCRVNPSDRETCVSSLMQNLSYSFYPSGLIQQITDNREQSDKTSIDYIGQAINTDATQYFEYDKLNRLTKAIWGIPSNAGETLVYEYDKFGNLDKKQSTVSGTVDYSYVGQKLTLLTNDPDGYDVIYNDATYDTMGNLIQKTSNRDRDNESTLRYEYNEEGHLISVYKGLGVEGRLPAGQRLITEMKFDFSGRRVMKRFYREDSTKVTTWYIGDRYELREDNEPVSGGSSSTKIIIAPEYGKIASINTSLNGPISSLILPGHYQNMANMIEATGFMPLTKKIRYMFLSWGSANEFSEHLYKTTLIILTITLLVLFLIQISRNEATRFNLYQKTVAVCLVTVIFVTACKTPVDSDQNQQQNNVRAAVNRPDLNLEGQTTDGVPDGTYYFHSNHIGSTSIVTNESGEITTTIRYNPFGEVVERRSVGVNSTTHKYTSQELDEEIGLSNYKSRFYDPTLGRFISPDSIIPDPMNAQSYNRYSYVLNNPIVYVDPTGHSWFSDIFKGFITELTNAANNIVSNLVTNLSFFDFNNIGITTSNFGGSASFLTSATANLFSSLSKAVKEFQDNFGRLFRDNKILQAVGGIAIGAACGVYAFVCLGAWASWNARNDGASPENSIREGIVTGFFYWFSYDTTGADMEGSLLNEVMSESWDMVLRRGLASAMDASLHLAYDNVEIDLEDIGRQFSEQATFQMKNSLKHVSLPRGAKYSLIAPKLGDYETEKYYGKLTIGSSDSHSDECVFQPEKCYQNY